MFIIAIFTRLADLRASTDARLSRLVVASAAPTVRVESVVRTAGPTLRSRYGESITGRIPAGVRQRLPRRRTAIIILLVLAVAVLVPLHLLGVSTNPTGHSVQLPAVPIDTGLAGTPAPATPDQPTAPAAPTANPAGRSPWTVRNGAAPGGHSPWWSPVTIPAPAAPAMALANR
ncbi:MAG TPA: hypothetical protein VFX70_16315 [Mycobacteriales bacterium]|nr:hypothetical protein [Mycobacteriales bacterium]